MVQKTANPEDSGAPVDLMRLAIALWQCRRAVFFAILVGTAAGAVVAKTIVPAIFEAQSVIECDRCSGTNYGDRELATLQETVKLPHHIERARQKLDLDMTLERLGRDVEVNSSLESRLIQVTARSDTASNAAIIANTIVEAFLETRAQIERNKLEERVGTLKIDAEKARLATLEARTKYDQFRIENGIGDLPVERQAAIQEAARLRSEAAVARAEEQSERARGAALRRATSKESSTAILQQKDDLPDARRLAEARAELATARARFSADHPRVQALSSEVESLERKVAAANESVTTERTIGRNPQWDIAQQGILQASAGEEAASMRQTMYEKLAQSAAQAVARLSQIEGRASELLANLQNAERHASTLELDLKAAEDAARTPSTGLRILAEARAPLKPAKSSRKLAALLGPILGSLLASMFVLLRELRGLRVHTAAELAFWGKGPVLTASQWPRSAAAYDDLVADLVGPLKYACGKTLVVGSSANELPLIQTLTNTIQQHLQGDLSASTTDGFIDALGEQSSAAALRRAVHEADRVIVVVSAAAYSGPSMRVFVEKLACPERIGFVLLNLREDHAALPDLAGDVPAFWNAHRPSAKHRDELRDNGSPTASAPQYHG